MLVELINITKYYETPGTSIRNMVLDDVSLSIGDHETISVIGPSGSGKSTLLNILGTLDQPSSGKVMMNGVDLTLMNEKGIANLRNQIIGHVFQLHYLLPQLTLLENVLLPTLAASDKPNRMKTLDWASTLITRVGLWDHRSHFPHQMSVGECQRGAVVRALINEPKILLCDEPTGSLDAINAEMVGDLLLELNRELGIALVIVTHSVELSLKMAYRYQLTSGRITRIQGG
ncbi:MAG: ABC transporter ATP-binding protein [Bacteroidota bacterium]